MAPFSVPQIIENIRQAKRELIATRMFLDEASKLDSYIEHIKQPLLIMVMGEFSTGKSTFINALVGKRIAVVDALPTTAVITKLCHSEAEKVMVYYRDGSTHEYEPDEFNRLTAESDDEANAQHEKIDHVERAMPMPVLRDMTIIDSPGLNALKDAHAEATKRFVEQADTVLWMISSEKAATDTEYQGIENLSPRLKPIVIVNKMDLLDEEEDDPERFLQNIRGKLKDKVQAVIGISAEYAVQGKTESNEELLAASNFSAFDDIVRDVILPNRDAYKVNSLIDELNEWLYGIMKKVQAAEEENTPNEEQDYNKYVENRSVLSRVEDALALVAQPLKDYCEESTNNASALALLALCQMLWLHSIECIRSSVFLCRRCRFIRCFIRSVSFKRNRILRLKFSKLRNPYANRLSVLIVVLQPSVKPLLRPVKQAFNSSFFHANVVRSSLRNGASLVSSTAS